MRRIAPCSRLAHGVARVGGRRVISGIVLVIRSGLRGRAAPKKYGPNRTIDDHFIRWSQLGVSRKIFAAQAHEGHEADGFRRALTERGIRDRRPIHTC
ncbi:MAG: transposase [Phenylobacterium sp.]